MTYFTKFIAYQKSKGDQTRKWAIPFRQTFRGHDLCYMFS